MEKQFSEQEIADRIIALHDNSHLGFRRITRALSNDGIEIGKDTAWRIYKKNKAAKESSSMEDMELSELRRKQELMRKRLQPFREKNAIRRDIALLSIQRVMEDFEMRRMLFNGEDMLFKFARAPKPSFSPNFAE